jgi:hypothetical protein
VRKFLGALTIAIALLAPAGAALAQDTPARDPFLPLVQPSPVATGDGTTVPTDPTVPVDPAPDPTDPLPTTGSSSTLSWAGLGYILVALGTGAVVLSKLAGPIRVASRQT